MAEQEDPELTSSYGHTKNTTIYRAHIDENELKTSRKDFLQLNPYRKNTARLGEEVETQYSQDLHSWVGSPLKGGQHNCRGSPQGERGFSSTSGSPAWESCTRNMSLQMCSSEASGDCVWDSQRAVTQRVSTLKGLTQNLTCSTSQDRGSNLKGVWVRLSC